MPVSLSGIFLALLLVTSILLYTSFCVIPSILLLPLSIKYSRICLEQLALRQWFGLVAAILELINGVKIVISGDTKKELSNNRPTLIIMNHRCRFDWLFLWCFLLRRGSLTKERIMLKSGIGKIPFIGWTMSFAMFIFVHRNWSDDERMITDMVNYYNDTLLPVQLLIFPEGSDLSDSNKEKDRQFAVKNGLHLNEYVMHPRTKGFVHCVNMLREGSGFDICDISVGYVGKIAQGEKEMLQGDLPSEIHFKYRIIPSSDISSLDNEELGLWLKKAWRDKEDCLKRFYQTNSFTESGPVYKDDWTVPMKLMGFIIYGIVTFTVFLYYLPWTIIIVSIFGIISYCVHSFKGGWSRIILNWNNNKKL